jgi:pectate lyase
MRTAWAAAILLGACGVLPVAAQPYQGFGSDTPGGAGQPIVRVTTLDDAGPGSLREALAGGRRTIVFDVAGDIVLRDHLFVGGPYVTIDGLSAPPPGITLRHRGLVIRGTRGAHDVIVRGLRVRDASHDGIQISYGAHAVVVDRVSIDGSGDGNLDVTQGSRDVTVSWSVLSGTHKNVLIKYAPARVTLHHNVLAESATRNPQVRIDDAGGRAAETTVDLRNNVVANWQGYGTLIWEGAWANVVGNYYTRSGDALAVTSARAYLSGNVSGDQGALDHRGTERQPFSAPAVDTRDACTAAAAVLREAGVHPRDVRDQQVLARVLLNGCGDRLPPPGLTDAAIEGF